MLTAIRPIAVLVAGLGLLAASPVLAQTRPEPRGKLDAHYVATLSGVPVGKGAWTVEIGPDQYVATVSGGSSGLLRMISTGRGSGTTRGRVAASQLVPASYAASLTTGKKTDEIHMTLASGNVKNYTVRPEPPVDPRRVPLTEASTKGVSDPMTAVLLRVKPTIDPLSPQTCRNQIAVFDGRMRFNIRLEFRRLEHVKAARGYQGTAVVCAAHFEPIAGHNPARAAIRYLASRRDIEVAFVPIAGTRILAPFRVVVPTPFGIAKLEATQFIVAAEPQITPASAR